MQAPSKPTRNDWAIVSVGLSALALVCAFQTGNILVAVLGLLFGLGAVGLGVLGLRKAAQLNQRGRYTAIAGIAAGVIGILAIVLLLITGV